MYDPKWVQASLKLVLKNKGSNTAGRDGITKKHLKDEKTREAFIRTIIYEMKNDLYEPEPARRTYIDKEKGGKRPLSIPTLKDRVVQQTLKLIIEPIFESDFKDCSIGFRPNRRCHDALPTIYGSIQPSKKYYWAMDGDIQGCFDNISHKILMRVIKKRIKDKRLLVLIEKILSAGYIEYGKVNKPGFGLPRTGTPQGGIISPLFANIYLHQFDKWFDLNYGIGLTNYQRRKRRLQGEGNAIMMRYADDFVVLFNGTKEKLITLKERIKQYLKQELSLELSEDKTLIAHVMDGFEFLGFYIKRVKSTLRYMTITTVPERKIKKLKQKIQHATKRGFKDESEILKLMAIKAIVIGFAEYYQYTNWKGKGVPERLDWFIGNEIFRWLCGKYPKLSKRQIAAKYCHRQKGFRLNGGIMDRENIGVKIESTYMEDEEIIWLAKMVDTPSKKYLPKKKPNPFLTYQYEMETAMELEAMWEGRGETPYNSDEYWVNRRIAMKRDKYKCKHCGTRITLGVDAHCHHIDGNNSNHNLSNLATMCMTCHYLTYGKEHELNL
jgi:group II intron reverse transcriptase/maturase